MVRWTGLVLQIVLMVGGLIVVCSWWRAGGVILRIVVVAGGDVVDGSYICGLGSSGAGLLPALVVGVVSWLGRVRPCSGFSRVSRF